MSGIQSEASSVRNNLWVFFRKDFSLSLLPSGFVLPSLLPSQILSEPSSARNFLWVLLVPSPEVLYARQRELAKTNDKPMSSGKADSTIMEQHGSFILER